MRICRQLAYAGVSLFTLASAPAFAQAVPPQATPAANEVQETGELAPTNEIVVSARRRTESVQDVPQTVNVVTAEQVEKLNLRNFTDIASVVPGLQLNSASAFSNTASVRGIAFDPAASGNNPSVEFYLNDAPISSGFLFKTTYDFGQFELQRGPQGTLRGRASPSGSITVTTRRPDLSEFGAVVNGTVTTVGARKIDGAINVPVIRDVLALRFAGVLERTNGNRVDSIWRDSLAQFTQEPFGKTRSYRISARFEPADWATFNVMYQNLHAVDHTFGQVASESLISGAAASGTLISAFDRLSIDEQGSFNRQDQNVLVGNVDLRFAGQRLSYVGSYNKQDFGILGAQDAANFFSPPRVPTIRARTPADITGFDPVCQTEARRQGATLTTGAYDQCTHSQGRRQSHELRLASEDRIAGVFDYVIGGFYDFNDNPSDLTQETPILTTATTAVPINVALVNLTSVLRRGQSWEKSVFGNLTAHLFDDKLELSGGVRYIDYKNQNALYQTSSSGTVLCDGNSSVATRCTVQSDSQHTNATIYFASAKYRITPDIMVYALTGTSWRPGPRAVGNFSFGPNRQGQTARELAFQNLPPERSTSYELGAKTSFADGKGRLNISLFHQKFRNYPFFGPQVFYISTSNTGVESVATANNPGGFGFLSPVPVTVKGAELEFSYQILERWSLGLNAAYADGQIKNGTIACTDLDNNGIPDVNAVRPASAAALQAIVGAGQTLSQCGNINRRANVTPKFSANIQTEYGFDIGQRTDGFVRGLYSFFGETQNNPDNPYDDVPAYGLLNLYAGIRDKDGRWEFSVFGKNILQERQILTMGASLVSTSAQVGATGNNVTAPYRSVTTTTPREFGLSAKVVFGSR